MATISITIPDAQIPRVREALCAYIDLTDPADITNANARAAVVRFVKMLVREHEQRAAAAAAMSSVTDPDVT